MSRTKAVRSRTRTRQSGPGLADTVALRRRRRSTTDRLDLAPGQHDEFLKKCRFVHNLLVAQRIPACSPRDAAAWTLAFADEGDPTFPILEWLNAGWRDPLVVNAALRICGTRERAEACLDQIGRDLAGPYEHQIVLELAEAMLLHPSEAANDP